MGTFLDRLVEQQAEGKALYPSRFFREDSPLSFYTPGRSPTREPGLLSQRESRHHLQAYGGSESIDWVMNCVGLYADTAANAPWHLELDGEKLFTEKTADTPPGGKLADKALVDLLRFPNPYMDYQELIELLVIDLLLVGNAYWYKYRMTEGGKPLALYRLSPTDVRIRPGPQGPEKYIYAPSGTDKELEIDPAKLIHFKRPNPHSPYYGLGVIKGGGRPFDLEIALTDSQAYYFENKADPSLIVQSERRVPRDVYNKIRAQLRARQAGTKNTGELMVLEAGLKAMTLQPTARDAMFRDLADSSRDRICAMFRVSPKLIGITEIGSAGDKVQDARREFDNKTMRPFLDRLQSKITWELAVAWGYSFIIDYTYIMPQEELVKLASDFASIPGVKVKEIRAFLAAVGLEESTGDPEIDEMVLNLPGEELGPDGQPLEGDEGFADRSLPREAGRPPKGENTRAFPSGGGDLPPGSRARKPKGKALKSVDDILARLREIEGKAVEFEEPARTTIGNKLPDEQRPTDNLAGVRDREVDAIAAQMEPGILDAVRVLERGLLDHVEGKAFKPDSLVKRMQNSQAWKAFSNLLTNVLESGAIQAVSSAAVHQGEDGRVSEDELDYEAIAKGVVHRPSGVRGITKNLKDRVLGEVRAALKKDDVGKGDIDLLIRDTVRDWQNTKAETVALTEATEAYNEGTLTVLEATGHTEVAVFDGEDHDDACKEANGQVWSIDQARSNRLEHPRCRRAFVPLEATA